MFKQRYTAPESYNKFYINTAGGGFNNCIRVSGYSVLPNCTGYAYGRFMEECGRTSCRLSTGNAQNWYGNTGDGYDRGQTPKLGAVMCWGNGSGRYGHVAIVEELHEDGSVTASMSNYPVDGKQYPYFERLVYNPPYTSASGLPFQGFIYNPYLTAEIPAGASDQELNGHKYHVYKQGTGETFAVLSAGLNNLARIQDLNADVSVMAKVTGANYFNNEPKSSDNVKNPDPYGTTYGDLSAPLNDVWTEVPNQNTTLYFDYETGAYGDCTGIHINRAHNVASPAVVYPATGNYQYARMVGIDHVNTVSRYTFAVRFTDGTYLVGLAAADMSPKQIAEDWRGVPGLDTIQFFDGGGSAQFGRWNGQKFEYVRDTGRKCPSAFAIIATSPYKPETEPTEDNNQKDEGDNMSENKPVEQPENVVIYDPEKIDNWTDPEAITGETTAATIAKRFLSVKSFVTLTLTGIFGYLAIKGTIDAEQFMSIFTMCISFFFGYQFEKKNNGNGGD